ncbi:hypothetical protein EYF80_043723 [Liparis tanakae]|uniref:Uncharacterized protein n=1 Tax=Liparis tanakae TaxID=230148 RepID=A0A4Z2FXX4_9TELE|nr:hypothetical protein EYF80_043723 [Liparis tanakae]
MKTTEEAVQGSTTRGRWLIPISEQPFKALHAKRSRDFSALKETRGMPPTEASGAARCFGSDGVPPAREWVSGLGSRD